MNQVALDTTFLCRFTDVDEEGQAALAKVMESQDAAQPTLYHLPHMQVHVFACSLLPVFSSVAVIKPAFQLERAAPFVSFAAAVRLCHMQAMPHSTAVKKDVLHRWKMSSRKCLVADVDEASPGAARLSQACRSKLRAAHLHHGRPRLRAADCCAAGPDPAAVCRAHHFLGAPPRVCMLVFGCTSVPQATAAERSRSPHC